MQRIFSCGERVTSSSGESLRLKEGAWVEGVLRHGVGVLLTREYGTTESFGRGAWWRGWSRSQTRGAEGGGPPSTVKAPEQGERSECC